MSEYGLNIYTRYLKIFYILTQCMYLSTHRYNNNGFRLYLNVLFEMRKKIIVERYKKRTQIQKLISICAGNFPRETFAYLFIVLHSFYRYQYELYKYRELCNCALLYRKSSIKRKNARRTILYDFSRNCLILILYRITII